MKYITEELPSSIAVRETHNGICNDGFQHDLINGDTDDTSKTHVDVVSKAQSKDTDHTEKNDAQCEGEGEDVDIFCGVGSCRPSFMQCCKNMNAFSAIFSISGLITAALGAYIVSQITTLEKQFNFSSSVSGVIMSCNDFGYLATTLFMSYYTRRVHIPRAMALSTILFGVSGIICAVAFFGTRDQLPSSPKNNAEDTQSFFTQTCQTTPTFTNSSCDDELGSRKTSSGISDYWKQVAIAVLAVGMILQGMAKSPRQPFALTYVDDNVSKTKTSLYFGVILGVSFFGPSLAFGMGAVFSDMYITLEETNITPRDPRWLGAWWLGFVIFGAASLVVGLPLICFPKRMHSRKEMGIVKPKKNMDQKQMQRLWHDFRGILKAMLHLVLNPIYVCLTLASSINLMGIIGMISFFNKYLETQFTMTASQANLTFGVVNVLVACIGTAVGGCMTTRLKWSPLSCLKFIIGAKMVTSVSLALGFVVGCDQPVLHTSLDTNSSTNQAFSQCVLGCNCDDSDYFPICGKDGNSYFSPCHAGCLFMDGMQLWLDYQCKGNGDQYQPAPWNTYTHSGILTTFTNCSCLTATEKETATGGLCETDCKTLYPYLLLFCIGGFMSTMTIMPSYIVSMRCVKEEDKPFAVGFTAFAETLIGWFPGPIMYGAMVDSTCMLWKTTCGSVGACALYDTEVFRYRYHALAVGLRIISLLFYALALILAVCSKKQAFLPQFDENVVIVIAEDKDKDLVAKKTNGDSNVEITTESTETYI